MFKIIVLGAIISLLFIAPISDHVMGDLHPTTRVICDILLLILGWVTLKSAAKEALHYMENRETDY